MNFAFNPKVAKVNAKIHAKHCGRRSNDLGMRAPTDRRKNRRTDGTDNITSSTNVDGNYT